MATLEPPPAVSSTGVVTPYRAAGYRTLNVRTGVLLRHLRHARNDHALTGIGSQYLGAFVDSRGEYLDGGKTYKVTLPPNFERQDLVLHGP